MMIGLWHYLRGYVNISVDGYFLEKFINICMHRQIFLWDIKKLNNGRMVLKISIHGFRMIRPVARKTGCRVRILRKRGVPFIINSYKGRKAFLLGAVLCICLFFILTSMIWTIEVKGNKSMTHDSIIGQLSEYGIKTGIIKYTIDTDAIIKRLMLDMDGLAWVSIEIRGTKIKIEIAERKIPPAVIPRDKPCNIVAARDGVIRSMVVKAGQEVVKTGETVKKGQLLVSGSVQNKNPEEKPFEVHAVASVKARTWYEAQAPVPDTLQEKKRTGLTMNHYSLQLFSKRINLVQGKISYPQYDTIEIRKIASLGPNMELPLELVIQRYFEVRQEEKVLDLATGKEVAADAARQKIAGMVPESAQIISSTLNYVNREDGKLEAVIIVECLEDIGIEESLPGSKQ